MKKNLRIVSAAAAALLAVAPVAASAVSVNAAATTTNTVAPASSQEVTDLGTLRGTIVLDRASNTQFSIKLSDAQKDAILQLGGDALKDAKPEDMKNILLLSQHLLQTQMVNSNKLLHSLLMTKLTKLL